MNGSFSRIIYLSFEVLFNHSFVIHSVCFKIPYFHLEPGPNTQTSTRVNDDGEVLISQETGVYYLKVLASFQLLCKEAELIKLRKTVTV